MTHRLLLAVGVVAFATGIGGMVFALFRSHALTTGASPTQGVAIVCFAAAGYCVAVAGSTLFRNVRSHIRETSED